MKAFMDRDFLLSTETAKKLFHTYAENMPILDYHCHINPQEIAEDRKFDNITQVWLGGDHYKWRAMRSNGVEEYYITGNAPDREKFQKWAETLELAIGNPLFHWSHLELQRFFGYTGVLNGETAEEVWNLCNEKLHEDSMSVRNLIRQSGVTLVCTTDDPADDLRWHKQIAEDKSFEDLLTDLEQSRVTIEKEQQEIASYKQEIETLKKRLEQKQERIDQAKDKILREANEKAREILQEAKDTADETIRIFQKAGPGASMKDLEKQREKVRNKISEKNSKLTVKKENSASSGLKPSQIKLGESVRIVSMGLKGTISSLPDHKGNLFVQCGIIRTQTNINDLVLVQEKDSYTSGGAKRTGSGKIRMSKSLSVSPEINLLGKTVDEALTELDKYLDDAYLAHLSTVRVVHGKGTGALRNAVQNHLRKVKYVKSYRLGEYGEGDAGVTIVEFKS